MHGADVVTVGAVLGGEETLGLLELTVTISARLTGSLAATNVQIGFDICLEEIEGAIKECMSEVPVYGTKWWPINFGPIEVSTACSATRRLEEEQRDQQHCDAVDARDRQRASGAGAREGLQALVTDLIVAKEEPL